MEVNTEKVPAGRLTEAEVKDAKQVIGAVMDNIDKVIIGKRHVIELVMLSLISGGHVLIEDVPGVGKTSLVHALARSINCSFKRIQFTPDIMPSDVTGFSIYNQKTGEFEFRPGAVMGNIILADEINRASAKTQASLLEAMEEKQVTVDSETYYLEEPFIVLATQNPIESFGTYPLPEVQIDRFLMKISIGYPQFEEEIRVVSLDKRAKTLAPVTEKESVVKLQQLAGRVHVDPMITRYMVELVAATRNHSDLILGSSPRGGIALNKLSRAYALLQGRDYVIPDDVKYLAPFALSHRISLTHDAKINKKSPAKIISSVIDSVLVPVSLKDK